MEREPSAEEMHRIARDTVERIVGYWRDQRDLPVARRGTAAEFAALVDEPLPEHGRSLDETVERFFDRVVPRMTHVGHPRFHAYIPCPSSFPGLLGGMLAAGTNPFTGSWLGGATVASLELTVLRWIAELVGYPPASPGVLTSGGSMANLVGLACARDRAGRLDALTRGDVYVSRERHGSLDKAVALLGFAPESLRVIDVDGRCRLRVDALRDALRATRAAGRVPVAICANAGTTNTGAIDPLDEIADVAREHDVWLHVDGAYGGFAALVESVRPRLRGMERADSLALDPHKWLYAPIGVGCVFVRDAEALARTFLAHGDYLQDLPMDEVNFMDRGPELSRPARVLPVWCVIRAWGRAGLAAAIARDLELARLVAARLAADERLELVDDPQLSVVVFRHRLRPGESESDRTTRDRELMEATMRDGRCMLSTTLVDGRSALRLVLLNPRTTRADLDTTLDAIREHAT
ncbi:MAG: aminotransferase class V-fold PLP-dependent enzyme [bacterium]